MDFCQWSMSGSRYCVHTFIITNFITECASGFIITHPQLEIHATTPAVLIIFVTSTDTELISCFVFGISDVNRRVFLFSKWQQNS